MIFSLGLRSELLKIIKPHWLLSLKEKFHKYFLLDQLFFFPKPQTLTLFAPNRK